ncbi:MAG: hypothetical protein ABIV06_12125 [Thermoanaerobaculia bacterium]
MTAALLCVRAGLAAPTASSSGSLDVTKYGVVYSVPAMADVQVEAGLAFGEGDRRFDLYRPPAAAAGATIAGGALPSLIFVNTTGAPFQEWEIYRDWARLAAAHGIAGVVYQNDPADASKSLSRLFRHLRENAAQLGLDPARIAIWACSANVSLALPWLHETPRPEVAAAVLYYGSTPVTELRTDLPVFYVLAGRDNPFLKAGMRTLFAQAVTREAPWTMVEAPTLTHAFDALDEGVESRRMVKETVAWLVDRLVAPPAAGPAPDLARQALTAGYGQEWAVAATAFTAIAAERPEDIEVISRLGTALVRSGQDAAAIPYLQRAIALGDNGPFMQRDLGQALVRNGDLDPGFAAIAQGQALLGPQGSGQNAAQVYNQLGIPAMLQGDMATAIRVWERALVGPDGMPDGVPRGTVFYNLACAYARSGLADKAFDRLGRAVAAGFGPRAQIAGDEDLVSLRSDPRFAALLEKVPSTP